MTSRKNDQDLEGVAKKSTEQGKPLEMTANYKVLKKM